MRSNFTGADATNALGGNDTVTLPGTAAKRSEWGFTDQTLFRAGAGDDSVTGSPFRDSIDGGPGNDVLIGGLGIDILTGGDHNDSLFAGFAGDVLGPSTDAANGQSLDGGGGDDRLVGGGGIDRLTGGSGNDWLRGGGGNDHLDGGQGIDTAVFTGPGPSSTMYLVDVLEPVRTWRISGPDGQSDMAYGVERFTFGGVTATSDELYALLFTGPKVEQLNQRFNELKAQDDDLSAKIERAQRFYNEIESLASQGISDARLVYWVSPLKGMVEFSLDFVPSLPSKLGNWLYRSAIELAADWPDTDAEKALVGTKISLDGLALDDQYRAAGAAAKLLGWFNSTNGVITDYDTASRLTAELRGSVRAAKEELETLRNAQLDLRSSMQAVAQSIVDETGESRGLPKVRVEGAASQASMLASSAPAEAASTADVFTVADPTGSDLLIGRSGSGTITGTSGPDAIGATGGAFNIAAGGGNDLIRLSAAVRSVDAGTGDDIIAGASPDISVNGGTGIDILALSPTVRGALFGERAVLNGIEQLALDSDDLAGFFAVQRASGTRAATITSYVPTALTGDGAANRLTGSARDDLIAGMGGNDSINAGGGRDWVEGGAGGDSLLGGSGNDLLFGGSGNDLLQGDQGADLLMGGAGADRFVYRSAADSGALSLDMILDFSRSQRDKLDLRALDADPGRGGDQAFSFIGTAAFTRTGQVRQATVNGDTQVQVNLNADATPELTFALDQLIALQAGDFIL